MTDRRTTFYRIETVAEMTGMTPARIRRYVRLGLIGPGPAGPTPVFDDGGLARLRKIRRLRSELGINEAGVEVVLRLLDEIERLHASIERPSDRRESREA